MKRKHWFLLLAGLVAGLFISGRYAILAQDRAEVPTSEFTPRATREIRLNYRALP